MMIQFDDILFRYAESSFELRLTALQLADGEAIALTGRSGCGKTTLLNLLAGILLPQQGQVRVGDVTVSQLPDAARRLFRLQHMGLVFQDFQLIDYLNVMDNVLLSCRLSAAVPLNTEIRDRAAQLVRHAGLEQYFRRSVTRLSQGERQRVAICRALLLRPELVLADEPTGNLDPRTADQILSLLMTQCRDHGATLVMVTHDQTLLPVFDRVIACDEYFHAMAESHPDAEAGADTRGVVR